MKTTYDCSKCPGYCCSIYERVAVTKRDLKRLAKHFQISEAEAEKKCTTMWQGERVLRRKRDPLLGKSCKFLDPVTRGCTIYEGRPQICRDYPGTKDCAYFDLIEFERGSQNDKDVLPLIKITFKKKPTKKAPK